MPIVATCSACGKRAKAKDTLAGKVVPCPYCGAKLTVPLPDDEAETYTLKSEPPRPAPPPPPPESHEDEEPEEDEQPTPKKKPAASMAPLKSNEPPLWLRHLHWLLVVALLARGAD